MVMLSALSTDAWWEIVEGTQELHQEAGLWIAVPWGETINTTETWEAMALQLNKEHY